MKDLYNDIILYKKEGTNMTIRWEEISFEQKDLLDDVFQLYDQSLPKEVREPHDILLRGLEIAKSSFPNQFHFLIGLEGSELVSFACFHYLAEVNTGFLVYLITAPNVRSRGIGSYTLRKIEEILNKDASLTGYHSLKALVLEVERQELAHTEDEKEDCLKRNLFYERNGFKAYTEIDYIQPPLNGETTGVPLNLFMKDFQYTQWTREEAIRVIHSMYQKKYASVNGIDPKVLNACLEKMNILN